MAYSDGDVIFDNDFNAFLAGIRGDGVVAGLVATALGTPNMSIDIGTGVYRIGTASIQKSTVTNVVFSDSSPTYPRKDIVVADSLGSISAVTGTPFEANPRSSWGTHARLPAPPDIPSNKILLAEVWIGKSATTITDTYITDKRVTVTLSGTAGVTDHGLLTGLGDDDHPQYQLESEKGSPSGYAGLGTAGYVPTAQLGSGAADATKVLYGNQSWAVPPAGGTASISDEAYGITWDGVTTVAPSKNALYDKINSLGAAGVREVTYVIAAYDATPAEKAQCDEVATGTQDFARINAAMTAGYRHVVLSSGTFIDATNSLTYPNYASGGHVSQTSGVVVEGQGKSTILRYSKATGNAVEMKGTGSSGNLACNHWLKNVYLDCPSTTGGGINNENAAWNHIVNVPISCPSGKPIIQAGTDVGSQQIYYDHVNIVTTGCAYSVYGTGLNLIGYFNHCNLVFGSTAAVYWHGGDDNSQLQFLNTQLRPTPASGGKSIDADTTLIGLTHSYLDAGSTTITNSTVIAVATNLTGFIPSYNSKFYILGNTNLGNETFTYPFVAPTVDWLNRGEFAANYIGITAGVVGNQVAADATASCGYAAQNANLTAAGDVFQHRYYYYHFIPKGRYLFKFRLKDTNQVASDCDIIVKDQGGATYLDQRVTLTSSWKTYAFPINITTCADFRVQVYKYSSTSNRISADCYTMEWIGATYEDYNIGGGFQLLKINDASSLPTASLIYRGALAAVYGGTGVADVVYKCVKSSGDTYSWVDISSATSSKQAPILIAASDATTEEKEAAVASGGSVCDGSGDEVNLNAVSGEIRLSSGTFHLDANWTPASNSKILGAGWAKTIIQLDYAKINLANVDNVEMGSFKVTGNVIVDNTGAVCIAHTASHEKFYFHDIWVTALGANHFYAYVSNNGTISYLTYERCFSDSPDGFGFILMGETTPVYISPRFLQCDVKNAGIAATRLEVGGICWVTGFDFAESPTMTIIDLLADGCRVDGAWESCFHIEENETLINARVIGCIGKNGGQKTGDPGGPQFGAGFYFGSGNVSLVGCRSYSNGGPGFVQYNQGSLTDCEDYSSVIGLKVVCGSGTGRVHTANFRSYNSDSYGMYLGDTASGDVIQLVGGGVYSSTGDAIYASDSANHGIDIDGVEIILTAGSGVILYGDECRVQNSRIVATSHYGVYLSGGTNLQVLNNRIQASVPVHCYDSSVIRPVVANNNFYGCTSNPSLSNATNPRQYGNIDKDGNKQAYTTPITIAASDATDAEKQEALASGGSVCDGVNDEAQLSAANTLANGALVRLVGHVFNIDTALTIDNCTLDGIMAGNSGKTKGITLVCDAAITLANVDAGLCGRLHNLQINSTVSLGANPLIYIRPVSKWGASPDVLKNLVLNDGQSKTSGCKGIYLDCTQASGGERSFLQNSWNNVQLWGFDIQVDMYVSADTGDGYSYINANEFNGLRMVEGNTHLRLITSNAEGYNGWIQMNTFRIYTESAATYDIDINGVNYTAYTQGNDIFIFYAEGGGKFRTNGRQNRWTLPTLYSSLTDTSDYDYFITPQGTNINEYNPDQVLSISSGAITVNRFTHSYFVNGESGADNLDQIIGGVNGQEIMLRYYDDEITIRHGENNIYNNIAGKTVVLKDQKDTVILRCIGGNWVICNFYDYTGTINSGIGATIDGTWGSEESTILTALRDYAVARGWIRAS